LTLPPGIGVGMGVTSPAEPIPPVAAPVAAAVVDQNSGTVLACWIMLFANDSM